MLAPGSRVELVGKPQTPKPKAAEQLDNAEHFMSRWYDQIYIYTAACTPASAHPSREGRTWGLSSWYGQKYIYIYIIQCIYI